MAGLTVDGSIRGNRLLMPLSFMGVAVSHSSHVHDSLVEQKTGFLGGLVIFTFGFEDIKKKRGNYIYLFAPQFIYRRRSSYK